MSRAVLALALLWPAAVAAEPVTGFRELALSQPGDGRPLQGAIWYPAASGSPTALVGDNPAFVGTPAARDAAAEPGRRPLVVLSHGYGGNILNQAWLADELVRHGYIVAAVNHPGTTSRDRSPAAAEKLIERPHDLSRAIDTLTADAALSALIDTDRIAVVGHSLGAWTVTSIAGGRFDAGRLDADCKAHPALAACDVFAALGAGRTAAGRAALGGDARDARVKAAVMLDIGLARGFTPESLGAIGIPVLVIAAGSDDLKIPAALESGYLLQHLPAGATQSLTIGDATHFSFLPVCKDGAAALLEAEQRGDGVVCIDGGKGDRKTIHRQAGERILTFLAQALGR